MFKALLFMGIFDSSNKSDKKIQEYMEQLYEYQEAEASILVEIATLHYENDDMDEATEFLKKAVAIYNELGLSEQEASILDLIGDLYISIEKTEDAFANYHSAYKIFSSINSPYKEDVSSKIKELESTQPAKRKGKVDRGKEDLDASLDLISPLSEEIETPDYLKIGEKIDDLIGLLDEYSIYKTYQSYKNPMSHIKEAFEMSKSIGDQKGEAALLLIMGDISLKNEESKKALDIFLESLEIFRKIRDSQGEAISRLMIGTAYFLLGDTDNGSVYLRQSMEIIKQMKDPKIEGAAIELLNSIYG